MSRLIFILIALLCFSAHAQEPNYYRLLDDEKQTLHAMIDTIMVAEKKIRASAFIIAKDRISYRGLALMRERYRRDGVESRIIGDALFHKLSLGMIRHLYDEGIQFRHHHPMIVPRRVSSLWEHPLWILERMHDKSLVADEIQGKFGGRNSEETYFGMAASGNYKDRDVLVGGPVLRPYNEYFDDLFNSDHVIIPNISRVLSEDVAEAERDLDLALEDLKKTGILDKPRNFFGPSDLHPEPLQILTGEVSGTHRDTSRVRIELVKLVMSTERDFLVENPYFIPSERALEILRMARENGRVVRAVTSSAKGNDGVLPTGGYLYLRNQIARTGVELWEYQKTLHSKSAVIDDRIALVGSFNLDELSAYSNLEIVVVSHSPQRAKELRASIEADMKESRKVTTGNLSENDGLLIGLEDFAGVKISKQMQILCAKHLTRIRAIRRHL